jgi:type I site-specific restriction endonuclease
VTEFLKESGDRFQKSIVFCVDREHAARLRQALVNDELMALCDRLEASLTITDTTRRRLLDALLAEALTPVEDHANMSDERALADDAA